MENKLSAAKMTLASLVLATAIGSVTGCNCGKYQAQARDIRSRINSSQVSDAKKKESKLIFGSFDYGKLTKGQKTYLQIPLEEKRKGIYEEFSPETLDYYHNLGLIDKENLSDVECLQLVSIRDGVAAYLK